MCWFAQGSDLLNTHFRELSMRHCYHNSVITPSLRLTNGCNSIFSLGFLRINPRVIALHLHTVILQLADNIYYTGIAYVRAVFLESKPHYQYTGTLYMNALFQHRLNQLAGNISTHAIIQPATGQDDLGVIAHRLCFMGEVIRVNTNTVPPYKTGPEWEKVPLGPGSLEHLLCINAQAV